MLLEQRFFVISHETEEPLEPEQPAEPEDDAATEPENAESLESEETGEPSDPLTFIFGGAEKLRGTEEESWLRDFCLYR
jgi:hypothetical protein